MRYLITLLFCLIVLGVAVTSCSRYNNETNALKLPLDFIPCTELRPETCYMQYDPVCGISDNGEEMTYGNDCNACLNSHVLGFTRTTCTRNEYGLLKKM